jgi:hypothetical protein
LFSVTFVRSIRANLRLPRHRRLSLPEFRGKEKKRGPFEEYQDIIVGIKLKCRRNASNANALKALSAAKALSTGDLTIRVKSPARASKKEETRELLCAQQNKSVSCLAAGRLPLSFAYANGVCCRAIFGKCATAVSILAAASRAC